MRNLSALVHAFPREHHWCAAIEHAVLRGVMFTAGLALVVLGLALGITMVMLPVGVFMALVGVATVAAAIDKNLPLPPDA